ncbi:MAG: hypothetical protein WCC26_01210 [Terracidiphilus sp.]
MNDPQATTETNPAIVRCCDALARAYQDVFACPEPNETDKDRETRARDAAIEGFRKAMPPLCGPDNIRNFIACVAYGMLFEVFADAESRHLLYAAQVANSARGRSDTLKPAA